MSVIQLVIDIQKELEMPTVFEQKILNLLQICELQRQTLEWYENWDCSDKYAEAVPKRAAEVLAKCDELSRQK